MCDLEVDESGYAVGAQSWSTQHLALASSQSKANKCVFL